MEKVLCSNWSRSDQLPFSHLPLGQLAEFSQSLLCVDAGLDFKPVIVLRDGINRSIGIDLLQFSVLEGRELVGWRGAWKELAGR